MLRDFTINEFGYLVFAARWTLALTAIVITFGVTAFLLALGYRSWQITRDDQVEDDVEDRLVERRDADGAEAPSEEETAP